MFNFVGELSKILFGSMDEDDAKYYNEQVKLFEQNSEDTNTLLKQQISVIRSSLGAVNYTLADVEYDENLLKEGINRVTKYMYTAAYVAFLYHIFSYFLVLFLSMFMRYILYAFFNLVNYVFY